MKIRPYIATAGIVAGLTIASAACVPPQVEPALIRNPTPCVGSVLMISDGTKLPCVPRSDTVINVRLNIVVPLHQSPTADQTATAHSRGVELGAVQVVFYPGSDPYAGFFEAENVNHSKVTS